MKKIFFIMSTDDYSGAETVNINIINGLKDKYDFFWVSKRGKINEYLKENNINWIEIKKLNVSEIKRVIKENRPDLLHATDYKASFICSLSTKKIPIISHIHNNAPWIKKISIKSLMFLYTGSRVNKIVTVSNAIEKEYIFSKHISDKIICLYNPVSYKKIFNMVQDKDFIKKYDICCCARLSQPKNPSRFLEIIKQLKDNNPEIKVVWIGDGELKKNIIDEIKEKELVDNIELVGRKKNPYKLMASSKIFLLTSSWEGFGLAAFEALSLGIPAVVTNVGGLPYIVDKNCGFVCETNKELCDGVNKLLKDNDFYTKCSKNAIEKAKKIDNYDKYLLTLSDIYQSMIIKNKEDIK